MKRINHIIVRLSLAAGFLGLSPRMFAFDASRPTPVATPTAAAPTDKAKLYDQKAAELDAVVAEHTQLKTTGMPGQTSVNVQSEMKNLNENIITDASKLRDDYRALASWHRSRPAGERAQ